MEPESRVLVLAPSAADAEHWTKLLAGAGTHAVAFDNLAALLAELPEGAGTLLLAEEGLAGEGSARLSEALDAQPAWSDLPLLLLAPPGQATAPARAAQAAMGNVLRLRRPLQAHELLSVVGSSLRDRQRQYEIRAHLAQHEADAEALREADRRKNEFLAMLAHELRNPLAPIRNGLQIIRLAGADPGVVTQAREMMQRQVAHLTRIVDDLLDVSRITRGKVQLRLERTDLGEVAQRAAEANAALIESRRHQLTTRRPPHPVWAMADPTRMAQALGNLLNNAAKYTDPGGEIALELEQQPPEAVFRVRDNGVGLAPDMLDKVFDLFVQAERSIDRSQGGLGIGLTLVRSLAEMHGGTAEAHSEGPGKGSEFVIRVPC